MAFNFPHRHACEIITFFVGPGRERFAVHRFRLDGCKYFETLLDGRFLEGQAREVNLPEDDPDIFNVFLEWLYGDQMIKIDLLTNGKWIQLFGLGTFADKYDLPELGKRVITAIQTKHVLSIGSQEGDHTRWGVYNANPVSLHYLYENTPEKSCLRSEVEHLFAKELNFDDFCSRLGDLPIELVTAVLKLNRDGFTYGRAPQGSPSTPMPSHTNIICSNPGCKDRPEQVRPLGKDIRKPSVHQRGILGKRKRCMECAQVELCESCDQLQQKKRLKVGKHEADHTMYEYKQPTTKVQLWRCANGTKCPMTNKETSLYGPGWVCENYSSAHMNMYCNECKNSCSCDVEGHLLMRIECVDPYHRYLSFKARLGAEYDERKEQGKCVNCAQAGHETNQCKNNFKAGHQEFDE